MNITVLRNQIKNIKALERGISTAVQFCNNIGLTLNITYQDINKDFDSQALHSDVVLNGWGINPVEILALATGTPDVIVLISTWDRVVPNNFSVSNPINPCTYDLDKTTLNNILAMEITEEWYNDYDWVLTQFFLHELCHALYDKTGILPDLTHFQYANAQYSNKQPTDYYLYLISTLIPSLKPQPTLNAVLTRTSDNGVETQGILVVGDFKCFALELPQKGNKPNISCIPKGIYNVKWTWSWRMLKYTYEVQGVIGRSGIRIHSGNYFFDTDGCILLGDSFLDINKDGETDVLNSRATIEKFEAIMGKKDFILQIK